MSRAQSVITFVTGVPGSGKSFREIWYLINEIIPELGPNSKIFTNLPLNIDVICKHFKDESLADKIVLISDDELMKWHNSREGKGTLYGPWSFFADYFAEVDDVDDNDDDEESDVRNDKSYLILDEIHEICNKSDSKNYQKQWEAFLATIRHIGLRAEFLTQDESAVSLNIKGRAGLKVSLEDNESELDPVFKISLGDWYNLLACYTRSYKKSFIERTYKKRGSSWGRMPLKEIRRYIDAEYFKFYNSFNHTTATQSSGKQQAYSELKDFQKYGFFGFHWKFFLRNMFQLFSRFVMFILVVWLLFFGGISSGIVMFTGFLGSMSKRAAPAAPAATSTPAAPAASAATATPAAPAASAATATPAAPAVTATPAAPAIPSASPITCILPDEFRTADGLSYQIGDDYAGAVVVKIEYKKRRVITDDKKIHTYSASVPSGSILPKF